MLVEAAMSVGADMIFMVKTNINGLCKDIIDNMKNDWMLGFYLVLKIKSVVPKDRPLISIGYKYKIQKVLYLIATEDTGNIKADITFVFNYPEPFDNVDIKPVYHPLLCLSNLYRLMRLNNTKKRVSLI